MARRQSHAVVSRDPDSQSEFRKRHGIINSDIPVGNAEALIRAHSLAQSRAVQKASLLAIDDDATADLDLDELSDQLGGDEVQSAAVRGNAIVVVALDPNGRSYKAVLPANDRYVPPSEEDAETEARAASDAELRFQEEVVRIRREHEEELAAAKLEMQADMTAQIQQLREELSEQLTAEAPKTRSRREKPDDGSAEPVVPAEGSDATA